MSTLRYRDHETDAPTGIRLRRSLKRSFLGDLMVSRRCHAYGIGIERTGTTFLASVFNESYRAQHEIEWYFLADVYAGKHDLDEHEIRQWLRDRDRTLRLEFESCHILGPFVEYLVDLFPEAYFILTIRHPRPWLSSVTNWAVRHRVLRPDGPWKPVMDRYYADPDAPDSPIYRPDAWRGTNLYSVDGYLQGWSRHNRHVLEHVPDDRLLVIPTPELSERLDDISDALGLNTKLTATTRTDRNRNEKKKDLLAPLDDQRLTEKIDAYCGDLIERFNLAP